MQPDEQQCLAPRGECFRPASVIEPSPVLVNTNMNKSGPNINIWIVAPSLGTVIAGFRVKKRVASKKAQLLRLN
jgi:hypothetical protein